MEDNKVESFVPKRVSASFFEIASPKWSEYKTPLMVVRFVRAMYEALFQGWLLRAEKS